MNKKLSIELYCDGCGVVYPVNHLFPTPVVVWNPRTQRLAKRAITLCSICVQDHNEIPPEGRHQCENGDSPFA